MRVCNSSKLLSYHFNWAECNKGVTAPAVGPGIPARILPLLKHILLPLTVRLLVSHPSEGAEDKQMEGRGWYRSKAEKIVGVICVSLVILFFWPSISPLFHWLLSLCHCLSVLLDFKSFSSFMSVSDPHSRSTQHQYGAHFLHAFFLEVITGTSQLMAASLEVFLLIDNQLCTNGKEKGKKYIKERVDKILFYEIEWFGIL